jgi:hypothetical protein
MEDRLNLDSDGRGIKKNVFAGSVRQGGIESQSGFFMVLAYRIFPRERGKGSQSDGSLVFLMESHKTQQRLLMRC